MNIKRKINFVFKKSKRYKIMNLITIFTLIISIFTCNSTKKTDFSPKNTQTQIETKVTKDSFSLIHLVRKAVTTNNEKPPVLILLHGYGSNESDLFSLAPAIDKGWLVVSARGPEENATGSHYWYKLDRSSPGKFKYDASEASKSCQTIAQFIDEVCQNYNGDPNRVVVAGFSQGAIMSASLGLTMPDKVVGFGMLSGRILEEVTPIATNKKVKAIVLHGQSDKMLEINNAHETKAKLEKWGIVHTYMEYEGVGHTISQEMLEAFVGWLGQF
jgi:phospholipase/carboxylesterase